MGQSYKRSAAALLAVVIVVGGVASEKPFFLRRNPIVVAVEKTRNSVVAVKMPRRGARDTVATGVIVDERGYVVTNRHVVGASGTVNVVLADGKTATAVVIAAETSSDLAILKLNAAGEFHVATLASVGDLMVGETVIAIGHPFGYTNTVSTGIISALNRQITMPTGDLLTGLIQTDASINPGNSGGPLLNINGEMIGINVALRDGAQGIAFAINAGMVKRLLQTHLNAAGLSGIHGLTVKETIQHETGARQLVVVAAEAAALTKGDAILAIDNRQVANSFDIERALWSKRPGDRVAVKIVRDGQELTVELTLASKRGGRTPGGS